MTFLKATPGYKKIEVFFRICSIQLHVKIDQLVEYLESSGHLIITSNNEKNMGRMF